MQVWAQKQGIQISHVGTESRKQYRDAHFICWSGQQQSVGILVILLET